MREGVQEASGRPTVWDLLLGLSARQVRVRYLLDPICSSNLSWSADVTPANCKSWARTSPGTGTL